MSRGNPRAPHGKSGKFTSPDAKALTSYVLEQAGNPVLVEDPVDWQAPKLTLVPQPELTEAQERGRKVDEDFDARPCTPADMGEVQGSAPQPTFGMAWRGIEVGTVAATYWHCHNCGWRGTPRMGMYRDSVAGMEANAHIEEQERLGRLRGKTDA